jgi:Mrp family chromosome partitioning ATPase
MDADIWGYSVPRMLGVDGRLAGETDTKKIIPHERVIGDGLVKLISMGFLVDELFGSGGGEDLAAELGVPLLGSVPIDAAGGDSGKPTGLSESRLC